VQAYPRKYRPLHAESEPLASPPSLDCHTGLFSLRRKLRHMFQCALKISQTHGQSQVFLELFSSTGHLANVFEKLGTGCVRIAIKYGKHCDLTNREVLQTVSGLISSHCVLGIWAGTPCSSLVQCPTWPP
jgi:hypothetical protein